jgi:hypothetical protein
MGGSPCTNVVAREIFGTRAEAETMMRQESANTSALLRGTDRTDVRLVRQQFYAGPVASKPTYPGTARSQCEGTSRTPSPAPGNAPAKPETGNWYLFEMVFAYTAGLEHKACTRTSYYVSGATDPKATAQRAAEQMLWVFKSTRPDARIVSTRVVAGPSASNPVWPPSRDVCN